MTRGRRGFNGHAGELLDVAGAAALLGVSEKMLRARASRKLIPFRKFGSRVLFVRRELLTFLDQLPGVTTAAALANMAARGGRHA